VHVQHEREVLGLDSGGQCQIPVDRHAVARREGDRLHLREGVLLELRAVGEEQLAVLRGPVVDVIVDRPVRHVVRHDPLRVLDVAAVDREVAVVHGLQRGEIARHG